MTRHCECHCGTDRFLARHVIGAFVAMVALASIAADVSWPGSAGGEMDVPANWGGSLPGASAMKFLYVCLCKFFETFSAYRTNHIITFFL